jgi:filamin
MYCNVLGHGPLSFSIQGTSQSDIGPSKRDKTGFEYEFLPKAPGDYTLHILWGDRDIPGSPFKVEIDPNPEHAGPYGEPDKVKVYGPGVQNGKVGIKGEFYVDVKEAGPGTVAVSMKGPSKAEISFSKGGDNITKVEYVCPQAGEYEIIVKFSDVEVKGSPFKTVITA